MDLLLYWRFRLPVTISSSSAVTYSSQSKIIYKGAKFVIIKLFEIQIFTLLSKCYSSQKSLMIWGWRMLYKAECSSVSTVLAALTWFSWATSYKLWYKMGPVNLENGKGKSSIALKCYTWVPTSLIAKLRIWQFMKIWHCEFLVYKVFFRKMGMV